MCASVLPRVGHLSWTTLYPEAEDAETHLRLLLNKQRDQVEKIKKATNFDTTRKLLEQYEDSPMGVGHLTFCAFSQLTMPDASAWTCPVGSSITIAIYTVARCAGETQQCVWYAWAGNAGWSGSSFSRTWRAGPASSNARYAARSRPSRP